MAATLQSKRKNWHYNPIEKHVLRKVNYCNIVLKIQTGVCSISTLLRTPKQQSCSKALLTVNTANATVPIMKPSELLNLSIAGGFSLCCVKDASHFGRAINLSSVLELLRPVKHYDTTSKNETAEGRTNNVGIDIEGVD